MGYEVLTVPQSDAITMLVSGESISVIARKVKVSRQTIYSWMAKDNIKAELDRRRQDLTHQGTALMLRDLDTYIKTIKELAQDKSDKRVCLAANQYLINRIYGNPTQTIETNEDSEDSIDESELEMQMVRFRKMVKPK